MRNRLRTLVMGLALMVVQVPCMGSAADVLAQTLKLEGIYRDADLSFGALGRDVTIDPALERSGMAHHIPREQDLVATMAQVIRVRTFERSTGFADDRALDPSAMSSDMYGEYSGPRTLPVAEPSTLLLFGSAIIGLATTMRRYGKRNGNV